MFRKSAAWVGVLCMVASIACGARVASASPFEVSLDAPPCTQGWSRFKDEPLVGMDASISAMAMYDDGFGGWPGLYVGGSFKLYTSTSPNYIARRTSVSWSPVVRPFGTTLNWHVRAFTVFDDGAGESLYVGGDFTYSGAGIESNRIARWDGFDWSALTGPNGISGVDGVVRALAVFDDGSGPALYVGGDFVFAGGVHVSRIARWDGTTWSALPGAGSAIGVSAPVHAMAVYDDGSGPALYVGGTFTTAGGLTVNRIAKWDGSAWSLLQGATSVGVGSAVYAMITHDDGSGSALYVGGAFIGAGGTTVNRVAKWDGSAWSPLIDSNGSVGVSGIVRGFANFDDGENRPSLVVGGEFINAGDKVVNRVAVWDGEYWTPLGVEGAIGVSGTVNSVLAVREGPDESMSIIVGGSFLSAGGLAVNRIARWRDGAWSVFQDVRTSGFFGDVNVLAAHGEGDDRTLFAGGHFLTASWRTARYVAQWRNGEWSSLGTGSSNGLNGWVDAIVPHEKDGDLAVYFGGGFTTAGQGVLANYVAKWNGESWSALAGPNGVGVNNYVRALAIYDDGLGGGPALYAGGLFTTAGGLTVNHIAKWNGQAWSPLIGPFGVGVNGNVNALWVFDDGSGAGPSLYVGGQFTHAGGIESNFIARWNGVEWSALEGPDDIGTNSIVWTITTIDDGSGPALYAGGQFILAGGVVAPRVAKWTGSQWESLHENQPFVPGTVRAVIGHNDGNGVAIYAAGTFTQIAGVPMNYIAKWSGDAWLPLSGPWQIGVDDGIRHLVAFDDGTGAGTALVAAGSFGSAGGYITNKIAKWSVCVDPAPCPGDTNGDGVVDFDDLGAVLADFGNSGPDLPGDLNGDGVVNFDDLGEVLGAFGTTCD